MMMDLAAQVRRVPDLMDMSSSLLARSASAAISPYQPATSSSSPPGGSVTSLTTPPPPSLGSTQDNYSSARRWNYPSSTDHLASVSTSPTVAAAAAAAAHGACNFSPYGSHLSTSSMVGATAPIAPHKPPSSYSSFSTSDYISTAGCQQGAAAMTSLQHPHQLNGLNSSALPPTNNYFYRGDVYGAAGNHHGMTGAGSFFSSSDYALPPLSRFENDACGATYMSDSMVGAGECAHTRT